MKLNTVITAMLALTMVSLLSMSPEVEAKRFGGGSSLGRQSSAMSRPALPHTQGQAQARQPAAAERSMNTGQSLARPSGASRWLGPLAGLAAGGLLASLFMGDAFQGFQILDVLLIGGLVLGAIALFRMYRGGQSPVLAHAPETPPHRPSMWEAGLHGQGATPAGFDERNDRIAGRDESPSWFDEPGFLEAARTHFIRLQAAWDQADFRDIREYTTPQLLMELQRERRMTGEEQVTEVVRLNAELVGVQREADLVVASVLFSGLIREEEKGVALEFQEVWHVQHAWGSPEGQWLIAGIQQMAV